MWTRVSRYWPLIAVLAASLVSMDCRGEARDTFWRARRNYALTMRVSSRPSLTPELQKAFAPLADTTRVALELDSLARDSLYGTYKANFKHLGVMVGAVGEATQGFAGRVWKDSVEIRLSPKALDASLRLLGRGQGDSLAGRWETDAGSAKGSFVLRAQRR